MSIKQKADQFRRAHKDGNLVLPNAWDAASAKIVEQSGAAAVATTSAGVAWCRGVSDGSGLNRDKMIHSIREIVRTTALPVTADIESGYGDGSAQAVGETIRAVIDAGAVGVNLEDSLGHQQDPIMKPKEQAERIHQARSMAHSAGVNLFINARTDVYLRQIGEPGSRLEAVLERALMYIDAGADGIFVPGLSDLDTIRTLAKALSAPLNVMAGPGAPTIPELQEAGVARISLGPSLTIAALSRVREMIKEVLEVGTYNSLQADFSFVELNELFK